MDNQTDVLTFQTTLEEALILGLFDPYQLEHEETIDNKKDTKE